MQKISCHAPNQNNKGTSIARQRRPQGIQAPGRPTREIQPTIISQRFLTDPGERCACLSGETCRENHPRVEARQSQKPIPRIHRGIDVKRKFSLPLTKSMALRAEPNCSSKNLGWIQWGAMTPRLACEFLATNPCMTYTRQSRPGIRYIRQSRPGAGLGF